MRNEEFKKTYAILVYGFVDLVVSLGSKTYRELMKPEFHAIYEANMSCCL